MFDKKQKPASASGASAGPSIIAAGLQVVGDIDSDGALQVDGVVEGNVRCGRVDVGENGVIEGTVETGTLRVYGTITGSVEAKDVLLMSTARLKGDVLHGTLAVEAGAVVDGAYRRMEATTQQETERRETARRFHTAGRPNRRVRGPIAADKAPVAVAGIDDAVTAGQSSD